jgi:hypothetical protein
VSAAEKAIAALEAAGKAANLPWIATDDPNDGCCWEAHVETKAKDRRGRAEDSIADAATRAVADHIALAVNLSAPLAAVARAAMAERAAIRKELEGRPFGGPIDPFNGVQAKARRALDAALDALEAAAEGVL